MIRVIALGTIALLPGLVAAPAGATCKCRARNVVAMEGQTVCIVTPSGPRLARCDKVTNVTSWTMLGGCPSARNGATHPLLAQSSAVWH
jgi:hypothetical protein